MVIKGVTSIDVTDDSYILEVGYTLCCSKIMVDRSKYSVSVECPPELGEIVVLTVKGE